MADDSAVQRPALLPLVPAYRLALALRELRLRTGLEPIRKLRLPLLSVGSLSAGGAGKTPTTIALAKLLTADGFRVDVLSRGYGRTTRQPARVDPNGTAEDFGDEPLLIAREAQVPVFVARQRYDAGMLAESGTPVDAVPPSIHLLDDGFQHRQLHRDIDILLLERRDFEDHLLPAGNLREPLHAADRAHAFVVPSGDHDLESLVRAHGWQQPIWRIRRNLSVPSIDDPVAAFCGIARPQQFFAGLESAGMHLVSRLTFRDHHFYTSRDLESIVAQARSTGGTALITTAKDQVRLGRLATHFFSSLPLHIAQLAIEFDQPDSVLAYLRSRILDIVRGSSM